MSSKSKVYSEGPRSKNCISDDILEMLEKSIGLAERARELSFRVHLSEEVAKSPKTIATDKNVSTTFTRATISKIERLQEVLADTIQTLEEVV